MLLVGAAAVDSALAYGLLRARELARAIVRFLAASCIIVVLIFSGFAMLITSAALTAAGPVFGNLPFIGAVATAAYVTIAIAALLGIVFSSLVFWYMGRPHVRAYFAEGAVKGSVITRAD